jgi:predicted metal-dependent phosphoesterase TrpH
LTQTHYDGRADVHMHTRYSDGLPTPRQLLDFVERKGHLDVIAITDHDVLEGSLWAYAQREQYSFDIIPGMEVTAREGHVLALWIERPVPAGMSVKETAAAIHEQGGMAILAHPGEPFIATRHMLRYLRNPQVLLTWDLDAVEVFNAGTITPGNNLLARRIVRDLPLPQVANSDAHTLTAIGCGQTRFPGRTAAAFRQAVLAAHTQVEGVRWSAIDYMKLSPSTIRRMLSDSSAMSLPETPSVPASLAPQ